MKSFIRLATVLLATGLLWPIAVGDDKAEKKDTAPKVVKLNGLIAAIKEHKGKVVVVDFWADT